MIAGADWLRGKWLVAVERTPGGSSLREASDFGEVLGWSELEVLEVLSRCRPSAGKRFSISRLNSWRGSAVKRGEDRMLRAKELICGPLILGAVIWGCANRQDASEKGAIEEDTMSGQVFIVTQARENVKLGLVTVALFADSTIRRHIAAKQATATAQRAALEAQIVGIRASIPETRRRVKMAIEAEDAARVKHYDAAEHRYSDKLRGIEYWQSIMDATSREMERQRAAAGNWERQGRTRAAAIVSLQAKQQALDSAPYYLEGLPNPLARTQTDADGEFVLKVPHRGSFVLVAHAQRQVGYSTEEYTWFALIPDEARNGAKVLLSNETLTTGGSPLSLVYTTK